MIRWKISRVGWAYAVASLAAVAGLVIESWQSDAADVETQVLADLSTWGFAGEFVLAGMGIAALAFWAGGNRRGVALGAVGLIIVVNSTMVGPSNGLTNYPTSFGADDVTLLELAESSPNRAIQNQMPTLLLLGEILGDATLSMPKGGLGPRIKAFTEVDVVAGQTIEISPEVLLDVEGERRVGLFGDVEVFVLGASESYFWIDLGPGSIVIVAEELAEDLIP